MVGAWLWLCVACAGQGATDDPGPGGGGGDDVGVGPGGTDRLEGVYEVTSPFDLTGSDVLPGQVDDALRAITDFTENPAGTLIELAAASGGPATSTALDFVPSAVRDQVEDWINDYVFDRVFEGVPATENLAAIVGQASAMLQKFDLVTELSLGAPGAGGAIAGMHGVRGIAWDLVDERLAVDLPPELDTPATRAAVAGDVAGVDLTLDDHAFAVPLGGLVVVGLNTILMTELGVPDLRGALGAIVDCPGLAADVGDHCISFVCVGHETELQGLCDAGLDAIVDQVEGKLRVITMKALQFRSGAGALHSSGGVIDAIADGIWDAMMDLGNGATPVMATFSATRM
jgi:hypothetical protein